MKYKKPGKNTYYCCAPNCENIYYSCITNTSYRNKSFFKVTAERKMLWIESVRKLCKPDFNLEKNSCYFCEDHFELNCFRNTEKNGLNKTAVPTIFYGSKTNSSSFNSLDSNICLKTTLQSVKEFVNDTLQNADKCQTSISDDFSQPSLKKPKYTYSKFPSHTSTVIVGTMLDEAELNTSCNINVSEDLIDDKQCFNSVGAHSNFIKSYVEMEEKIKDGSGFDDPLMVSISDLCVEGEDSVIKQEGNEPEEEWMQTKLEREDHYGVKTEYIDIISGDNEREAVHRSTAHKSTSEAQKYEYNYFNNEAINKSDVTNPTVTLHGGTLLDPEENSIKYKDVLAHKQFSQVQMYIKSEEHNEGVTIDRSSPTQKTVSLYSDNETIKKSDLKNNIVTLDTDTVFDPEENLIKHVIPNQKIDTYIHEDPLEMQIFKCDKCDFETVHERGIRRHQLRHRNPPKEKTYQCDECNYETRNRYNFRKHQLTHKDPSQVRMYKCDECSYESKFSDTLRRHQLKHKDLSQVRTYKCGQCDFETKYCVSIKKHLLAHSNPPKEEMYQCDECSFTTKYKNSFEGHQLKHKDPSQVQMYKCDECDYETRYRKTLREHQVKHKDCSQVCMYKCDKCNFRTKYSQSAKRHRLNHSSP